MFGVIKCTSNSVDKGSSSRIISLVFLLIVLLLFFESYGFCMLFFSNQQWNDAGREGVLRNFQLKFSSSFRYSAPFICDFIVLGIRIDILGHIFFILLNLEIEFFRLIEC